MKKRNRFKSSFDVMKKEISKNHFNKDLDESSATPQELYDNNVRYAYSLAVKFFKKSDDDYNSVVLSSALIGLWESCVSYNPSVGNSKNFRGWCHGPVVWKILKEIGAKPGAKVDLLDKVECVPYDSADYSIEGKDINHDVNGFMREAIKECCDEFDSEIFMMMSGVGDSGKIPRSDIMKRYSLNESDMKVIHRRCMKNLKKHFNETLTERFGLDSSEDLFYELIKETN